MTPFWAVILCALIVGGAVHGYRYWEARQRRKREGELERMFAVPVPSGGERSGTRAVGTSCHN